MNDVVQYQIKKKKSQAPRQYVFFEHNIILLWNFTPVKSNFPLKSSPPLNRWLVLIFFHDWLVGALAGQWKWTPIHKHGHPILIWTLRSIKTTYQQKPNNRILLLPFINGSQAQKVRLLGFGSQRIRFIFRHEISRRPTTKRYDLYFWAKSF